MRNPCRSPSTPARSRYGRILQIYFSVAHDPTELNYQGPDSGTQYRSTIFPTTPEQARIAKAYIAQLDQAHVFDAAIVTTIEPGQSFYPAEGYHQNFLTLNPNYPYIVYQRSAEDRESEADVSRPLPRRPGAGRGDGVELISIGRQVVADDTSFSVHPGEYPARGARGMAMGPR